MAEMIAIICPECKKQLKGPAELEGKKIRCKSCNATFTVRASREKAAPASSPAKTKPGAPPSPKAKQQEENDAKNGYQLTDVTLATRCPQCATEMDDEDVICLNCGYNTQTRSRTTTIKVYETTGWDYFIWLLPAGICCSVVLVCLGGVLFLWLGLENLDKDGVRIQYIFAGQVWGSVLAAFIAWMCGKFAFKRLVLHFHPPEKVRH